MNHDTPPLERIEQDLRFVRGAVVSGDRPASPAATYYFWAGAVLVGFALVDLRPSFVPAYWTAAGLIGFAVSARAGRRQALRIGQADAWRHLLHWGAVLVAIALAVPLRIRGTIAAETLHAVILLLLALGHFTAGAHGDRRLMGIGALIAIGYVAVMLASPYAWTTVGIALALGLAAAGVHARRPDGATA